MKEGCVPLRIAVNPTTIESAPLFMAGQMLAGDVELVAGKIPRLLDGSADAATNAETQALLFSLERPDIRIVLTVSECGYRIVAPRSSGIRAPADLQGKRVGTLRHTSSHFYVVKTLRAAGLSEADAAIVPVTIEDMPTALGRGDIDALSIWEPVAEAAVNALAGEVTILEAPELFRERFNLNTTAAVLCDAVKRPALVSFVRTLIEAARRVREQPSAAWPLLSRHINVAESTIERLWRQFRFPAALPSDLLPLLIEEEQWLAASQGRRPRADAALAGLIDDSILREAQRLAGR
ncbi:MAG TPA: ABC transporter substrate-binding protein [Alphaproteobacteria bacterium]|nr:ABC transporter substrate-binding protein [Alphaproteobacteria bacterium]